MEIANAKNLRDDGAEGRVAEKGQDETVGESAPVVAEGESATGDAEP